MATLLTLNDCAEALAVSRSTVSRLVKSGTLASVKLGKSRAAPIRVRPSDLDAFIRAHRSASGVESR